MFNIFKRHKKITGYYTVRVRRYRGINECGNAMYAPWDILADHELNLLTNNGRDFFHAQDYTNVAVGTIGSNYLAVTTDSGAAAAGDTTLATEITTNGLARAQATTLTHSAGTNTTTLKYTWTASGTHTNVQKGALFNASSAGIMSHEAVFTATSLVSGDQLELTWTLTLG